MTRDHLETGSEGHMSGRIRSALVVLAATAAAGLMGPPAVAEDACPMEPVAEAALRGYERQLLDMVNGSRSSGGLTEVSVDGRIVDIARRHAARMAEEGRIYHNPDYRSPSVVGAAAIGEVPTAGCSVRDIHAKIMRSPADRDVVLTHQWRLVGIGMASDDLGSLFVVEAYAQPAAVPTAPPATDPAPAPVRSVAPRPQAPVATAAPQPARQAADSEPAGAPVADTAVIALGETDFEQVAPATSLEAQVEDDGVRRAGILPIMAGALLGAAGAGRALVDVRLSARRRYRQRRRRTSAASPMSPKP